MTIIKTKLELPKAVKYVKYSEAKPGDTLVIGEYVGAKEVDNYNKDGKVNLHSFNTDEGTICLNGTKALDRLLGQVSTGSTLEVTFLGKESKVSKEGKKYRENTFEVSLLEQAS